MSPAQQNTVVVLSDAGRTAMSLVGLAVGDSPAVMLYVQDTDDTGLWVRFERDDGPHLVLILWKYVLSLDFKAGVTRTVGLRA
ncbi:MAG TPA: hypothetical protein VIX19_11830 [Terriglobales bacterium]